MCPRGLRFGAQKGQKLVENTSAYYSMTTSVCVFLHIVRAG